MPTHFLRRSLFLLGLSGSLILAVARPGTAQQLSARSGPQTVAIHTLRHDYVVRQWLGPADVDTQGIVHLQRILLLNRDWKTPDLDCVVFIQQQTGDVLQALAMPLGQ